MSGFNELTESEELEYQKILKKLRATVEGNICPDCNKEVKKVQVGRCVYGVCGHRLYQGTISQRG
jgi:hypothetical protein